MRACSVTWIDVQIPPGQSASALYTNCAQATCVMTEAPDDAVAAVATKEKKKTC